MAELNEKEDNDELYKDADYIVDEKAKTATLTPSGVKKAEAYFNIDNLTDADNITIQHHINQAIKDLTDDGTVDALMAKYSIK